MAAFAGAVLPGGRADLPSGKAETVYLLKGPIHYDILLPLSPDVQAQFRWLDLDLTYPGADWLVVGWGGRDFYTTTGTYRDITAAAVWKGATGDASVMRVALAGAMQADWPVRAVPVSDAQFGALLQAISESFAGQEALPVAGFSEFDAFYPAKGRFHIFRTCNVWIGEMLRQAGLPFGLWTPTPYAVTLAAHWHLP